MPVPQWDGSQEHSEAILEQELQQAQNAMEIEHALEAWLYRKYLLGVKPLESTSYSKCELDKRLSL